MKAQNMSWKDIGEALPGKDEEDIKKKYTELYIDVPADVKPKEAETTEEESKKETGESKEEKKGETKEEATIDEVKAAEESKKVSGADKKGGKEGKQGKKGQKGQKGQKGKEKAESAKPEEAKVEEAKPEEKKEILKAKATAAESGKGGELKSIDGHPVIFVDDDEELEFEEVSLRVMRPFVVLRLMFAIASISLWAQRALWWAKVDHGGLEVLWQVWKKDRSWEYQGEAGR